MTHDDNLFHWALHHSFKVVLSMQVVMIKISTFFAIPQTSVQLMLCGTLRQAAV